jgi:uncharacterized protein YjbI with pentapeptide repeats
MLTPTIVTIRNRWTGAVIREVPATLRGAALRDADLSDADLRGADLRGAVLSGAALRDADLSDAALRDADLRGADMSGADLRGAVLSGADLSDADLSDAVLRGADLSDAVLRGAVLRGADLSRAVLRSAALSGADLRGAVLSYAVLSYAVLSGADLRRAVLRSAALRGADLSGARLPKFWICPREGAFLAYKCVQDMVLRLEVPADAERTCCLISRKCRASHVRVLSIHGGALADGQVLRSNGQGHGVTTEYRLGEIVTADWFDPDIRVDCSHGIHFFTTVAEACAFAGIDVPQDLRHLTEHRFGVQEETRG